MSEKIVKPEPDERASEMERHALKYEA